MLVGDRHPSYPHASYLHASGAYASAAYCPINPQFRIIVDVNPNGSGDRRLSCQQEQQSSLETIHSRHLDSVSRLVRESILSSMQLSLSTP